MFNIRIFKYSFYFRVADICSEEKLSSYIFYCCSFFISLNLVSFWLVKSYISDLNFCLLKYIKIRNIIQRKSMQKISILILLFIPLLLLSTPINIEYPKKDLTQEKIVLELQKGGCVIYMRHGSTKRDESDRTTTDFQNCKLQRNLSEDGKKVLANIGKKLKKLKIPINQVLSSPYCRCKESATLVFNHYSIDDNLRFALISDIEETELLKNHLQNLLVKKVKSNSNRVLVSHTANLKEATDIWPKPEAVMVVFKQKEDGSLLYLGKILPNYWQGIK